MMFDDVRDLYQEVILDRGRRPRHGRRPAAFDASARGDNPMCGDRCTVFVRHDPDGTVREVGFEARGCAISALARTGQGDDPALEALQPLAGVHEYPSRVKCATLPWHALVAALAGDREASSE
jgi:nitrogen fixation NifU-like protein